jgi:hypothetical protein
VLLPAERDEVLADVTAIFSAHEYPRRLVDTIFNLAAPPILDELPLNLTTGAEYASWIVRYCLASRWQQTPALLDLLLAYLIGPKLIVRLQPVLDRVRTKTDPNPPPYLANWVGEAKPFFGRPDLRKRVQALLEKDDRPIFRIASPPDTYGRSYSREYFQYLNAKPPSEARMLVAVVSAGNGPSQVIADLAEDLVGQLGVTDPLPTPSSSDAAKEAARWILRHIASKPNVSVIVLDGYGQPDLNEEVRKTIDAVAQMVTVGQWRLKARLVLLDYPDTLPVSSGDILEEQLPAVVALTTAQLEPCIRELDQRQRADGLQGIAADAIPGLVARMFAEAPTTGKPRLEALNRALTELAEVA